MAAQNLIHINKVTCNFEREPLLAPFGFKGAYLTELWQSVVHITSASGKEGLGLGTQSVLWSDANVFKENSESAGNALMFALTSFAAKQIQSLCYSNPLSLVEEVFTPSLDYGRAITCKPDLRITFVFNALVPLDNAVWQLYCQENNIASFDEMVPAEFRHGLSYRHDRLALIPLVSYGVPVEQVVEMVRGGVSVLKIKIGCDPDADGDLEKTLSWDIQRVTSIHNAIAGFETPYTDCGHVVYYLDANGRYDSKERLVQLLESLETSGVLERVILLEEPFPEGADIDVNDLPVRIAADESAHSAQHVARLIDLGYGAIALKPAAKTLSETLRILSLAHEKGVPCFCADLTVNPVLVDWNKNVAARLAPLPGVKIGLLEMNGDQNYRNWERMFSYHPRNGATWMKPNRGVFVLDESFYESSGGILEQSDHYRALVVR